PRLRHRTGHGVLRHLKRPAAPECASRTPCSAVSGAQPSDGTFDFCTLPIETHAFGFTLPANAPEGQKRFPISATVAGAENGERMRRILCSTKSSKPPRILADLLPSTRGL